MLFMIVMFMMRFMCGSCNANKPLRECDASLENPHHSTMLARGVRWVLITHHALPPLPPRGLRLSLMAWVKIPVWWYSWTGIFCSSAERVHRYNGGGGKNWGLPQAPLGTIVLWCCRCGPLKLAQHREVLASHTPSPVGCRNDTLVMQYYNVSMHWWYIHYIYIMYV